VKVSRSLFTPAGRIQLAVKTTTTNDRGRFRLSGLNAGRYFLSAGTEKPLAGRAVESPAAGDYAVQFYPGVDTLEQAIPIDVTSGGELNVNLKIFRQRGVAVRGIIVDSQTGKPPDSVQWQLIAHPENGNKDSYVPTANYDARTGEFELINVWLGVYVLEAETFVKDSAVSPIARTRIVVQDSGIENLRLYQIRPLEVTGRVRVDGGPEAPVLSGVVEVLPIDPQSSGRSTPPAKVAADGTFRITGLVPGDYLLRLQDRPAVRSYIRNITYDASDILNFPWHFSDAGVGTLDIVRGAGAARLTGIATNSRSEPAAARIVLLPEARFRSDLYKSAVTDRTGRFTFTDIEPGEYRLFAFEVLETGAEFDPEFMKAYEPQGRGIHVVESGTNSMDIRTVPKP
jgi:5-hydroxyisourate hydrolase-like protein (transthyretin family)